MRWNVLKRKKKSEKFKAKSEQSKEICKEKGRTRKKKGVRRDRLKREKWRRGRIKMDKEREIMSDERRQPEVPTWMSDLIAEFQHLCQLWNVKRQLIHLCAAVGTNKPLACNMLSNRCHLIIHFDRGPQKVIVLKRMSQKNAQTLVQQWGRSTLGLL